jgi:enoyl-CoA hydratase
LENDFVIKSKNGSVFSIILNRPDVINCLNLDMINTIWHYLKTAYEDQECRLILIYGLGVKGFCAGGDIKALAGGIKNKNYNFAMEFFRKEYELDLLIHRFPKPVIIIADGIAMGGGLGLAAGADMVIATERTVMSMPEAMLGFFPDTGATGWMYSKCREGYPEFIGLTGYEMKGPECVRVGFADYMIKFIDTPDLISAIESLIVNESLSSHEILDNLKSFIAGFVINDIPQNTEMDAWVRAYFHGKDNFKNLLEDLKKCGDNQSLCKDVFTRVSERSPTALALTLILLKRNKERSLVDVFADDLKAAEFMIRHHDFHEGFRARLLDKDNNPGWQPASIDDVDIDSIEKILN